MTTATVEAPQHLTALEFANRVRIANAKTRAQIKRAGVVGGMYEAAAVLTEPDEIAERMRLGYLLASIERLGPKRAGKLLHRAGIQQARQRRRLCELSERERMAIADELVASALVRGRYS